MIITTDRSDNPVMKGSGGRIRLAAGPGYLILRGSTRHIYQQISLILSVQSSFVSTLLICDPKIGIILKQPFTHTVPVLIMQHADRISHRPSSLLFEDNVQVLRVSHTITTVIIHLKHTIKYYDATPTSESFMPSARFQCYIPCRCCSKARRRAGILGKWRFSFVRPNSNSVFESRAMAKFVH